MFASNVITTQQLHSILCVLIYLIIHPFGIQNVRCLASLFQALEQASHLRVQFRKPLAILVQFLCRLEEPVVVSSPRSFSGTTETRVSKAPVQSSQAEDVLFGKVCTTRQRLGCNTQSTSSHPRGWTFSQDYAAENRLHQENRLMLFTH